MKNIIKFWLQKKANVLMEPKREKIVKRGKGIKCPNCKN